jgi:hypothetical protein
MRDPVAVYTAAGNVEAHVVCNALIQSGINATAVEDVSTAGLWMFGVMPQIHKPQVWIERCDVDQAKAVLDEYERRIATQRQALEASDPIYVTCEECGERSSYPATQRGTVQDCTHCYAFVDVDDLPWADSDDSEEGPTATADD